MHKLISLIKLSPKYLHKLELLAPNWKVINGEESSIYMSHLEDAEVIVGWNKDAEKVCFKDNSSLNWIHSWGAGVNNIPLEKLKQQNIILTNSSGVHAFPISETVFSMILMFTRRIHLYLRNQLKEEWKHENNLPEVHGKTIGIIGVGAIGEENAKLGKAFGMKVLGLRRSGKSLLNVDKMFDMKGLNELISESDYIVNTLPLTKETYKLIGLEQFRKMKRNSFYVNIGRGETTDSEALIKALEENLIAGAGLDVFDQEPLPKESPLWKFENVIITPHNSGATYNYEERTMDIFIKNFKSYLNGEKLRINVVDLDKQY
ncbi:D-2-hydroxyacid dehydrogenase [Clostridium pasteurianum]|uniref:Phosphoglycerate dehydrogenase-like oxidoreductase n=1 Tax=Clostridium pasteurianum BC1 TaxID=86416 RepID=R4KGZ6_CLOPA|nr:D-2-hydroxyacid dehydrogenase [Clostridium pasteurianum]AGK98885.1 phosphoglycerate dehydrogenase-like oxidoreductase [Clostridium pasteurianum BC1]